MGLKEEIQKLVEAEHAKLELRDEKHREFHAEQQRRFQPIKAILAEITAVFDENKLRQSVGKDAAILEFSSDLRLKIEPNFDVNFGYGTMEDASTSLFVTKPGFRVDSTSYHHDGEVSETTLEFADEAALTEYLVEQVVQKAAHYKHIESITARAKKHKDDPAA